MASDNDNGAATKLTYLLIGGGIGAIIALLFAPKSGRELRGDIADATRKGIDYGREQGHLVGERAGEYYERGRERAEEYYERGRERANELYETGRERVSGIIDTGRDTVVTKRDAVSAAIEAGKTAYQETKRKARAATDEGGSENQA